MIEAEQIRDGLDFLTVAIDGVPGTQVKVWYESGYFIAQLYGDFEIASSDVLWVQTQMKELGWFNEPEDGYLQFRYPF